jgi:prephenate dehydratase
MKIGYQGIPGAYHAVGAEMFFKKEKVKKYTLVSCDIFETIFKKVSNGELDLGIVACENSLAGSIYKNFDLLNQYDLKIVGEVYVHVKHQLLGIKGTNLKNIKQVHSQWPAIEQCRHTLEKTIPNVKFIEEEDTALSAKLISEWKDPTKAAIASSLCEKAYGLKIIKKDVMDDKENYTRFFILAKNYAKFANHKPKDYYKTSIVFSGGNVPGFLFKSLGCFATRDINLEKIESRPKPKSPWQHYFYLDFLGKYDDENVIYAINNLKEIAKEVKVLGSYKADKI